MRTYKSELVEIASELVQRANFYLPNDVYLALEQACEHESGLPKAILRILLENAIIAAERQVPICQDTGIDVVFLEVGPDICLDHEAMALIDKGIAKGTVDGFLRASVCDPLTRQNTRDNTPSVFHVKHVKEPGLRIRFLPKGCGSENMSAVMMLPPSKGVAGVVEAVVGQVRKAGPNPCPPGIIGVGIGGTMEQAALLSKEALLRPIGKRHERNDIAELEQKIFQAVNELGIGPHGFGGRHSALHVAVNTHPCHIASLPVAINIQCHAARQAEAIWLDGKWEVRASGLVLARSGETNLDLAGFSPKKISLPLSNEEISGLRAGDWVLISGSVLTGRDQTHKKLCEMLEVGKPLPVELSGEVIYYVGPSPAKTGVAIGSAGPTTSYRMDAYTPLLLSKGVKATIGKGRRSLEVVEAMKSHKAVYFATIGGAGAYLARCITGCKLIAFPELGTEALYRLEFKDFPVVVVNDMYGNDFYDKC